MNVDPSQVAKNKLAPAKLVTALLTMSAILGAFGTVFGNDIAISSALLTSPVASETAPATAEARPAISLPPMVRTASLKELLSSSDDWQDRSRSSHLIAFELSPRQIVEQIELDLVFPSDLNATAGAFEIRFNNHKITHLYAGDKEVIAGRVQLVIDGSLLASENNFLQVYLDSEMPLGEALDIELSRMFIKGKWKQQVPNLGDLNAYFKDKTTRSDPHLHLCFPATADTGHNLETIRWGALASQGVALRMDQLPPVYTQSSTIDLSQDNLVIGEARDLTGYLSEEKIQKITGPFIAVDALPNAPHRLMMVISGRTAEEVSKAALAFGFIHFGYPHTGSIVVNDISLPVEPAYIRKAPVFAGTTSTFKQLGYESAYHPHDDIPTIKVNFDLDVWAITEPDDFALLQLDYWVPSESSPRIEFNIEANGELVEHIVLGEGPGAELSEDRRHGRGTVTVAVPMAALHAGQNQLQIVPVISAGSITAQPNGAKFSILDSSTIELPSNTPTMALPNLALLQRAGFPFVGPADGSNFEVILTDANDATVAAAWTVMAKIAQVTDTFLYNADIRLESGSPASDRQTLVIGAIGGMAESIRSTLPITAAELTQRLSNQGGLFQVVVEPSVSGKGPPKTMTFLTAMNRDALPQLCQELVRHSNWSRISGDLTTWGSGESLSTAQLVKPARLFDKGLVLDATLLNNTNAMPFQLNIKSVYWAGLLLIIAVPFALITHILVGNESRSRRNIALPLAPRAKEVHPVAAGH